MSVALLRHPQSAGSETLDVRVDVERRGAVTVLRYVVTGAVGEVQVAPEAAPERTDELWRTTCFEAFVRAEADGYVEFNFAPSRRWAAYRFDGYRSGMVEADVPLPVIETTVGPDRLEVRVEVAGLVGGRMALSAVIENAQGRISYWALAHPGEKPDFHHPDSFALKLAPS